MSRAVLPFLVRFVWLTRDPVCSNVRRMKRREKLIITAGASLAAGVALEKLFAAPRYRGAVSDHFDFPVICGRGREVATAVLAKCVIVVARSTARGAHCHRLLARDRCGHLVGLRLGRGVHDAGDLVMRVVLTERVSSTISSASALM